MHEIITIQLGQRSNYLATHFWNLQESYFTYSNQPASIVDHDVHFRAGVGADGTDTYTPRTVIYDLKGGFGSLRKINALYDVQGGGDQTQGLWDGNTAAQKLTPIPQTKYQQLLDQGQPTHQLRDADIRYWSDFNRVFYHPRSMIQLNEYELNSQLLPFDDWSAGEDLFKSLDRESDLIDRDIRPFVEECDQMQGMQMFSGIDNAWGGFASEYLEHLRDEYGKSSIWVWGLGDGRRHAHQRNKLVNTARSLRAIAMQASAYTTLYMPPSPLPTSLTLDPNSEWQCAGLLCSALETATLPTRLRRGVVRDASLGIFEELLQVNGNQNIFDLYASYHVKPQQQQSEQNISGSAGHLDPSTSAQVVDDSVGVLDLNCSSGTINDKSTRRHIFAQIDCHRQSAVTLQSTRLASHSIPQSSTDAASVVEVYDVDDPFPFLDSFPNTLFGQSDGGSSLRVSAGIVSSSVLRGQIINLRNFTHRWIEMEEKESFYHDLTSIADEYSYGWDSGSDSDNDGS